MIKVVWNIIKKSFGFVLLICSPFKRLFCRRKRRTSDTVLPLTNHYSIPQDFTRTPSAPNQFQPELQSWENWDQDQSNNSRSGNHNYSRSRSMSHEESSEPEPDYFQDMTPKIKRQKKVLVKQKEEMRSQSNKFAMSGADVPLSAGPELGTWDDRQTGWDDEGGEDLSWQAEAAIKEQKRSERRERNLEQQRRKQDKEFSKRDGTFSAVRLS